MNKLKDLIENRDTRSGALFDYLIQILIILSLLSFAVETLPDLSEKTISILEGFELICIVIFTAEYILRLIIADKGLSYFNCFYGIIDLLAILPYYLFLCSTCGLFAPFEFFEFLEA